MAKRNFLIKDALGDYIHLKAENYLKHGTLQSWNDRTNFQSDVFTKFRNEVLNRSQQVDNLKQRNMLLKAQRHYNKVRRENFNILSKWWSNPNTPEADKRAFLEKLVSIANMATTDIDFLLNNMQFNTKNQSISLLSSTFSAGGHLRKASKLSKDRTYSWLSTIKNRLNNYVIKPLNDMQSQKKIPNELRAELLKGVEKLNYYITSIEQSQSLFIEDKEVVQLNQKLQKEESEKAMTARGNSFYFFKSTNGIQLSPALSDFLNEQIRALQAQMNLSISFNNIMAAFAEFMAGATNRMGESVAISTIDNIINTGVKGSHRPKVTQTVKDVAGKTIQKYNLEDDAFGIQIIEDKSQGKVDAIVTIKDDLQLAASIKNYNLSNEFFYIKNKGTIPSEVALVKGTTLSSLLLTAEGYQRKLGTHFLNVLSEKEGSSNQLEGLRQQALETLKIFLVYIGLTGGHGNLSMREAPGADVLIVEDKTDGYAYFFSISGILGHAMKSMRNENFSDYFYLNSNGQPLDQIWLKNTRVGDVGTAANINARIGKVLSDARAQKLEAAISIPNYINKNKQR